MKGTGLDSRNSTSTLDANVLEVKHGSLGAASDVAGNGETLSSPMIDDLISRAQTVLSELESFRDHIRRLRQEGSVEIATFRGTVQSELGMLERLSQQHGTQSTDHIARSSNLPFLEHVWQVAKRSKALVALSKRIYLDSGVESVSQRLNSVEIGKSGRRRQKGSKDNAVVVDAITEAGRTWTKLSLVTNNRLLFDLAKNLGWESSGSDEEESAFGFGDGDDNESEVPLLKTARQLTRAAKLFRVRTKHPEVHIVLPRIVLGETAEIDKIVDDCRGYGAIVVCGAEVPISKPLPVSLDAMAPDPLSSLSEVLNIDCTILLALVSEFSHAKVSKEAWFHVGLQRQVDIEDNENLLPALLYPALVGRTLVCTKEAAARMREIVATIGTASEKARTAILMGDHTSRTQQQLVDEMQEWSAYHVPTSWNLPIIAVDQNQNDCQSHLPEPARAFGAISTAINSSVFLYGWATARTTITSNRTVVKQIEHQLGKYTDLDDAIWPSIWLCPTARSLVGKEKRATAANGKKEAMSLTDPLRREEHRRNGLDVLSMREGYEVEDWRQTGYPCEEVLAAKNASRR